jgi:hypothetical protein
LQARIGLKNQEIQEKQLQVELLKEKITELTKEAIKNKF